MPLQGEIGMTAVADLKLYGPPELEGLGVGEIAVELAKAIEEGDVLFAATDEQSAIAVTHALSAAAPNAEILFCPSSDALPGDDAPASPANVGHRVSALLRIRQTLGKTERPFIACVTTGEALGRLYPPPTAFDTLLPRVAVGQKIDLAALFEELREIGYLPDERVDEPGEIALRGLVLDVYPADADAPLRIEASEHLVTAIRLYDPVSQRTTAECERRELGRVAEPSIGEKGVPLLAHLPMARVVISKAAEDRRQRFIALAQDAERRRPKRAVREVADNALWAKAIAGRDQLRVGASSEAPPRFIEGARPLPAFVKAVKAALAENCRVALLGGERDLRFLVKRVASLLKREIIRVGSWAEVIAAPPGTVLAMAMPVERGFKRDGVLAVASADLLGSRAERDDSKRGIADAALFSFGDIRVGDVVVHEDHGIAVVGGLQRMPTVDNSDPGDAIALTFAGGGIRLVPVAEADRIWRYGAEEDAVALDRLDGGTWEKRRGAIDAAIGESARVLTDLARERETRTGPVLVAAPDAYERFAAGFAFSETADQARAISAVRDDLASGRPMDRLVIGDVGYGKTEVALRAAAIAALSGRQVAVAAPTTVLARQHLENFSQRFEGTNIVVAGLSRLSTATEKKIVKAGLANGTVHVVVGTGAVAAKDVRYKDLALVVIDEEQRFGAADKSRMRELGAAHVLALSATPIPRTLQSALIGLQQLSVIATPPGRRQPIRTSVGPFVLDTVRTALLREKGRGGQSFVVVPRIDDMAALAGQISRIVPELKLVQAHGKMPAAQIDDAMVRFGRGDGDILLATNIIEAGLDVPRANTMVIWRADRFGLSQLHQLRGRVGRGSRRGQVMLLTDPSTEIAPRTLKRLRTLEAFDRLGAGFAISGRDLDIRGAGDLLGEAQAGHMKLIGIDLYQYLLEAAIRTARGEDVERWTPDLNIGVVGRFPEDWLPDEELRVALYCRLARIDSEAGLDVFAAELEDRFGAFPSQVDTLLRVARIRVAARLTGIARVDAGPAAIALTPRADFSADGTRCGLEKKNGRLLLTERINDPSTRLDRVEHLIEALMDGA
jgi:transcription-repair coupling factor (superfamily II helicase)